MNADLYREIGNREGEAACLMLAMDIVAAYPLALERSRLLDPAYAALCPPSIGDRLVYHA